MRRQSDHDDDSYFQRSPSYRIATIQGTSARPNDGNTNHPLNATSANPVDNNQKQWPRRDSYGDSAESMLENWLRNHSTSSSASTVYTIASTVTQGSRNSTQRRDSYCDAMTKTGSSNKTNPVIRTITNGLKSVRNKIFGRDQNSYEKDGKQLIEESDPEYIRRWASLWLTWLIMFILVLQFSMYSTTLAAYLPLLDRSIPDSFAPWAISAFGFGQTIGCPIFGWWSNRIKNNRLPMAVGVILMIVGNIGFCFIEIFPIDSRKYLLFIFRFIIGLGGGIAGVIRAYCATAAKPHEYTKAVTGATAALSLAIMAGPGAQAMFAPIGYPGVSIGALNIHMYNAPALTSLFIGVLCVVGLYTVLLQKYPGLAKDEIKDRWFVLPKYDICATWVVIFCWFAAYLTLTSFVMIGKSYTMVMFHWSYVEAVVDNGIIMGVFACISLVVFILYAYYGKRFDERTQMYIGISMMCSFFLITFPWPGLPRLYPECGVLPCCESTPSMIPCVDLRQINKSNLMEVSEVVAKIAHDQPFNLQSWYPIDAVHLEENMKHHKEAHHDGSHSENFPGGCQAVKYKWCDENTKEPIGLYMGTFFLLAVGFPLANCAFSALFSKIIGPRRQGFMQGIIIAGGAAARTSGPLFINYTFDWWGPRVAWGLTSAILVSSILLACVYHRRLIPLNPRPKLNPGEHFHYKNGVLYRF